MSVLKRLNGFVTAEHGQDLVEYGLLVSLIATFVIGALDLMGDQVDAMWLAISTGIPN